MTHSVTAICICNIKNLTRYDERGEGTSLRSEVKKPSVTSHQSCAEGRPSKSQCGRIVAIGTVKSQSTVDLDAFRTMIYVLPVNRSRYRLNAARTWSGQHCITFGGPGGFLHEMPEKGNARLKKMRLVAAFKRR
jgi:hypothetical protein